MKKKVFFELLPIYLIFFIAILLIGMLDFVSFSFNPARLYTREYWTEVGIIMSANNLVLIGAHFLKLRKLKDTDEVYLSLLQSLKAVLDKLRNDFSVFMYNYNLERKKVAYKAKIRRKIWWLDLFRSKKDFHTFIKGTDKDKEENKYCKKRALYEHQLTDTYLNEYIDSIWIRYPKIKESFVKNGVNSNDEQRHNIESGAFIAASDLGPRVLVGLGISMVLASLLPGLNEVSKEAWGDVGVRLLFLLWNWNTGTRFGEKYFTRKIVKDTQTRLDIGKDYTKQLVDTLKNKG